MKFVDPSVCPQCGAVYEGDRWRWGPVPANADKQLCQACRRINDHYPAGEIDLSGDFVASHKEEIIHLALHQEELEKAEHPLHRIMSIEDRQDHLSLPPPTFICPAASARPCHSAYKGSLDVHYDEEGYFIRARWTRSE